MVRRVGESNLAREPRATAMGSFLNSQTTSGIGLPSTWQSSVTDWPSYPTLDSGITTRGGAWIKRLKFCQGRNAMEFLAKVENMKLTTDNNLESKTIFTSRIPGHTNPLSFVLRPSKKKLINK